MNNSTKNNSDIKTVHSFGDEWARFDQSRLGVVEVNRLFDGYFNIFPWDRIAPDAEGFDMGCGSGRWAKLVAPRVGRLHCIDPSNAALGVARKTLESVKNVDFYLASADDVSLPECSQDFGYSLGVLHHVPDTEAALSSCVKMLKPKAPFLLYLYYRFDNRPAWFKIIWRFSELFRSLISRLPATLKAVSTDIIAAFVYFPFARLAWLVERSGYSAGNLPLSFYRHSSFYSMRTDSRDRFGTPLERRFSRIEIQRMMERAGLQEIEFSDREPYWCAMGIKGGPRELGQ